MIIHLNMHEHLIVCVYIYILGMHDIYRTDKLLTDMQGQTESADFFGDFCAEFLEKSVEFCGMVL